MKQYLDALRDIRENGCLKNPARAGMPKYYELNGMSMVFDFQDGFPIITTKSMYWKGIVGELLWFLRGDTNIKFLVDNNIHIWDDDAFKYYNRLYPQFPISKEEFIENVKKQKEFVSPNYKYGDCGKVYGYQWRHWEMFFDQIYNLVKSIKESPDSRYHIVSAWNPQDFLNSQTSAALPACHMMFQCFTRKKNNDDFLDLVMYQRSCDFFLGVPFNISSYALLLYILSDITGYLPGKFTWIGGSCHIYDNHLQQVDEQLNRKPLQLPTLSPVWGWKDRYLQLGWEGLRISDFELSNYQHLDKIKAPLSVGV